MSGSYDYTRSAAERNVCRGEWKPSTDFSSKIQMRLVRRIISDSSVIVSRLLTYSSITFNWDRRERRDMRRFPSGGGKPLFQDETYKESLITFLSRARLIPWSLQVAPIDMGLKRILFRRRNCHARVSCLFHRTNCRLIVEWIYCPVDPFSTRSIVER